MNKMKIVIAAVVAVGLAGCEGCPPSIDSKQPNESSVAAADMLAYRYVRSHNCRADYRSEPIQSEFDYVTGTTLERPQHTAYKCHEPDVTVLVDDARK